MADYSAALLRGLRRFAEVTVQARRADIDLYHLGNNRLHGTIYRRALDRPGVVVLHDTLLHHFFLGALDENAYVEEFVYNYGEWAREQARELWRDRGRSSQDARFFRYPMLRRIAEASRAVVVHNPVAAGMVREHAPAATVIEIPHLFERPALPAGHGVERLRCLLGVSPSTTLFAVFGYLRESKRLFTVLRAFARVRNRRSDVALLLSGEFVSGDLERALESRLAEPGVIRTGYLPESDFWRYARATDVCVNLRHPSAGETSGIAVRLMGIGRSTIVTDGEEYRRFPPAACLRVDSGPPEVEMLASYMHWLAGSPSSGREIGRRAEAHIAAEHALDRCAERYWETLRAAAN